MWQGGASLEVSEAQARLWRWAAIGYKRSKKKKNKIIKNSNLKKKRKN